MVIHRADSVDAAIELAERLREQGVYQWFRGQTRDWPLRSSLQRRSPETQDREIEWLTRFRGWLGNTKGMWQVAADTDQSTAVAQHYGIATDFVDFTPDPSIAAFFATHEPGDVSDDEPGVILCLNHGHLQRFWEERFDGFRSPELIQPAVPNLWRLESQRGVFLVCPYRDFEQLYPLDRIVFPRSPSARVPTPERIYPTNKSALEILLDQFFMRKAIHEVNEEMLPLTRPVIFEGPPERYDPDAFIAGRLDRLPSWDPDRLRPWLDVRHEAYEDAVAGAEVTLPVPRADPAGVAAAVAAFLRRTLAERPGLRAQTVRFAIDAGGYRIPKAVRDMESVLPRLWDGLRALPYTDDEVALGCANCVAIRMGTLSHVESSDDEPGWWDGAVAVKQALGAAFEVEFGQDDGSYSRSYVLESELRSLIRPDFYDLVKPELREKFRGSLYALLLAVHAPDRLFDFRGLARLFAVELAPIQVLTRRRRSNAIVFSPARLRTFGLR